MWPILRCCCPRSLNIFFSVLSYPFLFFLSPSSPSSSSIPYSLIATTHLSLPVPYFNSVIRASQLETVPAFSFSFGFYVSPALPSESPSCYRQPLLIIVETTTMSPPSENPDISLLGIGSWAEQQLQHHPILVRFCFPFSLLSLHLNLWII